MEIQHRLLKRQISKYLGAETVPENFRKLLDIIEKTYVQYDEDSEILNRSLELSSSELLEANSEMRAIFQSIPDGFYLIGNDGTIKNCVEGGSDANILKSKAYPGKKIQEILIDEISGVLWESIESVIKGKSSDMLEYSINKENEVLYYEARIVNLLGDHATLINREITDKKRIEQKIIKINEELNNFSYMVSHDIKASLNTIKGFLVIIENNPNEFTKYFPRILKSIEVLLAFVENLLKLSQAGKIIEEKQEVNLNDLLKTTIFMLKNDTVPVNYKIDVDTAVIDGEPVRLQQVFLNLISNSIKFYNEENKSLEIEIDCKKNCEYNLITLKDNGVGIAEDNSENIFTMYYTKGKQGGSGFGLAIVKKIIESHGGSVWYESEGKNKGTTFYIKLPIVEKNALVCVN